MGGRSARDSGSRLGGAHQGREAERHVDEEDRAPAGAEDVEVDQRAAEHRPEHRAQPDHGAEQAERLADLVGREDLADDPEALRDQERGEQALDQARGDQRAGGGREPAQHRRGSEAGDADQEQAAAAVDVAEPRAGDEADGERQRVAADHPLQPGRAGAEVAADGRRGDVDDHAVEQVHALGGEHHGEDQPALGVAGGLGVGDGGSGRSGGGEDVGHERESSEHRS